MKRATDKKIRDFIKAKKVIPLLVTIYKGVSDDELSKLMTKLRKLGGSEVLIEDMEEVRGSYKERVYKAAEED